jgi:tetratricopeptide (TPR) repeat protein
VYPFLSGIIPSLNWTEWNTRVLWGSMPNASIRLVWATPGEAVLRFALAFWDGAKTAWFTPFTVSIYLLLVVIFFPSRRTARSSVPVNAGFAGDAPRRFALAALLYSLAWLWPAPKFGRYLLPGVACALAAFLAVVPPFAAGRMFKAALSLLLLAESMSFVAHFRRPEAPAERVLTGAMSQGEFRRAALGKYQEAVDWLNARPPDPGGRDRTLVIGQGHGFGVSRPLLASNETGFPAFLEAAGPVPGTDRMRARFRQAGVRWVLYNPIRAYHRSSYLAGYRISDEWWMAYADLWRSRIRPSGMPPMCDWTGAWYVYRVLDRAGPPANHAWLPGAERLLLDEAALARGDADPAAFGLQKRVMGDFGVSLLQSAFATSKRRLGGDVAVALALAAINHGLKTQGSYNTLGCFLWNLGRRAEARRAFTRALELDPSFAPARANLDDAVKALSNKAKAE